MVKNKNLKLAMCLLKLLLSFASTSLVTSSSSSSSTFSISLPGGKSYSTDWDDDSSSLQRGGWVMGSGREFSVFDSRGGSSRPPPSSSSDDEDEFMERYRKTRSAGNKFKIHTNMNSRIYKRKPQVIQTVQNWWASSIRPSFKNWPKMVCRVEPTTTLKLRKTFRPLKTIVRLGADFNTQLGVWQFQSSWEDAIIGGTLTLIGKELQLTKSWQLSVGAVEDLVTRLRFRAAINLQTCQAYARVGFRTERLSPINVMEGFTIVKRLPLDGSKGNVKLEVKANVALPEPEIEYSTETQHSSLVGMGDVEVSIDELNLVLDF